MAKNYVQAPSLYLAGSGTIIGATSITLEELKDIYGNAITSITPFGDKGYITLEPDTSNEEAATFTGVTVNANGTVTLTGIKTILAQTPYTETSGLVRSHAGSSLVVITDNVAFWSTFANKNNANTFTDIQTFPDVDATRARISSDTDTAVATAFVTLGQLSRQAISGASNAATTVKGIVQLATQAQVDARTATGSTGALLVPTPDTNRSTLLSDYKADTGAANAYVITPSPAITAYTVGQIFSFKAVNANTTTSTLNVNGLGVKTINKAGGATALAAGDIAAGMIVEVEYDGTNFVMLNPVANAPLTALDQRFGGDGSDGALSISSGTTNIDCGGAAVVIKNYTSVSITGTGQLTFSNPHANGTRVYIRSQGNVTLTSSTAGQISVSGLGVAGGTGGVWVGGGSASNMNAGSNGTNATDTIASTTSNGGGALAGSTNAAGTGGTAGAIITDSPVYAISANRLMTLRNMFTPLAPGGGGGDSGATNGGGGGTGPNGGDGGRGGGWLFIECRGTYTASGSIYARGNNGSNGGNGQNVAGTGHWGGGGGGGGAGGFIGVLYNTLGSNSATLDVSGGIGGIGGTAGTGTFASGPANYCSSSGGGGAGGLGGAGTAGTTSSVLFQNTTAIGMDGRAGGPGGLGLAYIAKNTVFA